MRRVGTFRAIGFNFERWVDTVIMQRPLVAATAGDRPPDL